MAEKDLSKPYDEDADFDSIPLHTKRTYDAFVSRFGSLLAERALAQMRGRGSVTPTDVDVGDAYRDLTRGDNPTRGRKCVGDLAMIVGGVFLPLWGITPLLTVSGVLLCLGGLYVREYAK